MKNIFRPILFLAIAGLFSISAYGQGSGSTQTNEYQTSGSVKSNSFDPDFATVKPSSFEVTKTVKASIVKVEKGRLFLKTKKGKLLNLKLTANTKITSKKKSVGGQALISAKFIRVSYLPESSKKEEPEAVKIKVLE